MRALHRYQVVRLHPQAAGLSSATGTQVTMSFRAGLGTALILALAGASFARAEERLHERLRTEAPAAWKALADRLLRSEGEGTRIETATDGSGQEAERKETRISFRVAGSAVRIEATGAESGNQVVFCMNSRYGFQLNRDAEADPFVIRSTVPRIGGDVPTAQSGVAGTGFEEYDNALLQFLGSPWIVDGRPLAAMVCQSDSKIHSVTPVEFDGRDCVKVRFSYFPADEREDELQDATVVLDPARNWSVQEYDGKTSWGKVAGEVQYDAAAGDWPVPQKVTQRMLAASKEGPAITRTMTFEFDKIEERNVPEAEFTLTAFDFPELPVPGDQSMPSGRRRLLIMGNVFLGSLFALLLVVRFVRQRRSA
jgi:hypothetical protein